MEEKYLTPSFPFYPVGLPVAYIIVLHYFVLRVQITLTLSIAQPLILLWKSFLGR
jgi:hypothetical protein